MKARILASGYLRPRILSSWSAPFILICLAVLATSVLAQEKSASPGPTPSPTPAVSLRATTPPGSTLSVNSQSDLSQGTSLQPVVVTGRQTSLVGIAGSASEGVVSQDEISERPILRPGEVLETVPGMIITQHAGGGKANQ
ncbi:MAG TPA: hypothetical protein VHY59_06785, partial [Chthoniobacterales bacterium]|nr:hypothetical protein [Chthoniobacterales bacterium]